MRTDSAGTDADASTHYLPCTDCSAAGNAGTALRPLRGDIGDV